jgi:hypothetical protein
MDMQSVEERYVVIESVSKKEGKKNMKEIQIR